MEFLRILKKKQNVILREFVSQRQEPGLLIVSLPRAAHFLGRAASGGLGVFGKDKHYLAS